MRARKFQGLFSTSQAREWRDGGGSPNPWSTTAVRELRDGGTNPWSTQGREDGLGTTLLESIVAYWDLDEASGDRADSVGGAVASDVNTTASAAGVLSNGADFVAANTEYLTRAGGLTASGTSRSVSLWAKPDLTGTQRGVANATAQAATPLSAGPMWIIAQKATDVWAVYHGNAYRDSATPTIVAGTWYHLVYTFESTTNAVKLYVNGVERASATAADTGAGTHTYIGSGFSAHFDGVVDEFGIWSRALTQREVTELYNGGVGVTYPFE